MNHDSTSGYFDMILKPVDLRKLRVPHNADETYYDTYMSHLGVGFFLNTIAAGQLPAEIALDLALPVRYMMNWITERTSPEERDTARIMCAESLLVKSKTVLLMPDSDATTAEVQLAREYSKRLAWIAERLDADKWGPPRPSENTAPPSFNITINGNTRETIERKREELRQLTLEHGLQPLETLKMITSGNAEVVNAQD